MTRRINVSGVKSLEPKNRKPIYRPISNVHLNIVHDPVLPDDIHTAMVGSFDMFKDKVSVSFKYSSKVKRSKEVYRASNGEAIMEMSCTLTGHVSFAVNPSNKESIQYANNWRMRMLEGIAKYAPSICVEFIDYSSIADGDYEEEVINHLKDSLEYTLDGFIRQEFDSVEDTQRFAQPRMRWKGFDFVRADMADAEIRLMTKAALQAGLSPDDLKTLFKRTGLDVGAKPKEVTRVTHKFNFSLTGISAINFLYVEYPSIV